VKAQETKEIGKNKAVKRVKEPEHRNSESQILTEAKEVKKGKSQNSKKAKTVKSKRKKGDADKRILTADEDKKKESEYAKTHGDSGSIPDRDWIIFFASTYGPIMHSILTP
jgi:hypothetical protein